jgi:hypothetical protein
MKFRPSKQQATEFATKMREIDEFCKQHDIQQSRSGDSYYFTVNGKKCRVSNHTTAKSNDGMWNSYTGELQRDSYHIKGYDLEITASKTRIIDIYNALLAGKDLDKRGNEKPR